MTVRTLLGTSADRLESAAQHGEMPKPVIWFVKSERRAGRTAVSSMMLCQSLLQESLGFKASVFWHSVFVNLSRINCCLTDESVCWLPYWCQKQQRSRSVVSLVTFLSNESCERTSRVVTTAIMFFAECPYTISRVKISLMQSKGQFLGRCCEGRRMQAEGCYDNRLSINFSQMPFGAILSLELGHIRSSISFTPL